MSLGEKNRSRFRAPSDLEITVLPMAAVDQPTRLEIIEVCKAAFNDEEFDELFTIAATSVDPTDVIGRLNGIVVSHGMWSTRRLWLEDGTYLKTAFLDAVATDPKWQGHGFGSAIIRRLCEEISEFDISCLTTNRVSFYENLGWERWAGPLATDRNSSVELESGEFAMVWRTPKTPPLNSNSVLTIEGRSGSDW